MSYLAVSTLALVVSCTDGNITSNWGSGGEDGSDFGVDAQAGPANGSDTEPCNGLDDDRDGRVDEGCTCTKGDEQPCWPGLPSQRGLGICKDGIQTCLGDAEFSSWGPCVGAVIPSEEIEGNGIDESCDGADVGCTPQAGGELCIGGMDEDCDRLVDCNDPDCAWFDGCACEPFEAACDDGLDNDCDGTIDCEDPDCAPPSGVPGDPGPCGNCWPLEIFCSDGQDDDCDGAVDAEDDDCSPGSVDTYCIAGPETFCGDLRDDDCDNAADCQDPDCASSPECACTASETACADGRDDDCDGLTDCADADCDCGPCRSSLELAFVTCDPTVTLVPGPYTFTTFTCNDLATAVGGGGDPLAAYDTIVYFGWVWDMTTWPYIIEKLEAGAKVIKFADPSDMLGLSDVSAHYHELPLAPAEVTVTAANGLTAAFDKAQFPDLNMVQLHSGDAEWCGDLFFNTQVVYDGHFHGYYIDSPTRKGVFFYIGLSQYTTKVVDFTKPFLAAHIDQTWASDAGTSGACGLPCSRPLGHGMGKPVIYLYPPHEQKVSVRLDLDGSLVNTYPSFDPEIGGWDVIARPDGTLVNLADGHEYSYIYWSGISRSFEPDFSEGFVVPGSESAAFLREKLSAMGLEPREYNELIVYWLPYMKDHAYNLVHFAGKEYTSGAKMRITPEPDSLLRVFMVFRELAHPYSLPPQEIAPFERKGFTVVEWGGTEVGGGDWSVVH